MAKKQTIEQLANQARNDYMRQYMRDWRKKNPQKVRDYQANYWMKKIRKILEPLPEVTPTTEDEKE